MGAAEAAAQAAAKSKATSNAESVNYDKELRKLISAMEMNFNSGVANIKKVLDQIQDNPNLLAGKSAGLTSTLQTMEMKLKKDVLGLKRKLMDAGKKKDEL